MAVSPSRSAQTADIDKAAVSKLIRRNSFYSQRGIVTLAGFLIDGGDCYVVGTRIEGLIERHKANGEWTDELPDRYPDVESRDEIEALAVFLRACESDHGPSEETALWAGTQQP